MSFPVRIFPANKVIPWAVPASSPAQSPQASQAPLPTSPSNVPNFQASVVPALWPPSHIFSQNPLHIKVTTILPTWMTVRIGHLSRSIFAPPGTHVLQVLAPGEARRLFPPGMNRYSVTVTPKGGSTVLAARSIVIVGVPKPQNPQTPLPGATRNPGAHPILNRKFP